MDSFPAMPRVVMNRFLASSLATLFIAGGSALAEEFRYELTHLFNEAGFCPSDCEFDLGREFLRIESADIYVRGNFKPGVQILLGGVPGEFSNGYGQAPFDDVNWNVPIGDVSPVWPGKIGRAINFQGIDGDFEIRATLNRVPEEILSGFLLGVGPAVDPAGPADLTFLLDGIGAIQGMPFTVFAGQVSTFPILTFEEVTLVLEATPIPETNALAIGLIGCLLGAGTVVRERDNGAPATG